MKLLPSPALLTAMLLGLALRFWLCDARGHPAETWEQVAPATRNDALRDLVTDGAIFFALTDDAAGTVLRSVDGVHFVREPLGLPGSGPNEALLWHAGQWHAVRGGVLFRKTPAALWEAVPLAPPRTVGLASVEGELWAWTFGGFDHTGGDPARVLPQLWRKADAAPWVEVTVTAAATSAVDFSGLIRENGRYILSGNGFDFDVDDFTGGVWTSSDGVNWVVSAYGDYRGVAWNGVRFAGGSNSGRITFSDDGVAWFRVPFPFVDGYLSGDGGTVPIPSRAASISWFNNAFWVVTSTLGRPILAKSADGTEWSEDGWIHRSGAWRDFYHEWRQSRFPAGPRDIDAISGPAADPDGDGASNALEYACGLDPLLAEARLKISFDGESRTFHHPRSTAAAGVALWTEFSEDLQQWRRTGLAVTSASDDFDPALVQVWASPTDPAVPRGFFRLRATLAPPGM